MGNLAFASESDLTFLKPVPAGQDGAITQSFGIPPVQAQMLSQAARNNPGYGADPMWVNPGTGWRPKGLGLAGMGATVPGQPAPVLSIAQRQAMARAQEQEARARQQACQKANVNALQASRQYADANQAVRGACAITSARGLQGLAGMAGSVPGMGSAGRDDNSFKNSGNISSNANTNTNTATGGTSSAQGGNAANTITIQGPQGAGSGLTGESGPYVLALGGLVMFGGIFYLALRPPVPRANPPRRRRSRRGR